GADPSGQAYGKLVAVRTSADTGEDRTTAMTSAAIPPIVCNQPDDVAEVIPLEGFRLHVRFFDGTEGEVDMSGLVHGANAGVFAPLANPARFAEACVRYGAVTWPGDLDLAPDAMYTEIKAAGKWILM
ncbi:MAG: DUF2442 domain-containing protein, partial [Bryobacteraceae bacterium]